MQSSRYRDITPQFFGNSHQDLPPPNKLSLADGLHFLRVISGICQRLVDSAQWKVVIVSDFLWAVARLSEPQDRIHADAAAVDLSGAFRLLHQVFICQVHGSVYLLRQ